MIEQKWLLFEAMGTAVRLWGVVAELFDFKVPKLS